MHDWSGQNVIHKQYPTPIDSREVWIGVTKICVSGSNSGRLVGVGADSGSRYWLEDERCCGSARSRRQACAAPGLTDKDCSVLHAVEVPA